MKKSLLAARLPLFAAALGAVGFGLRRLLYAMTADAWGLLPWGHPLEALLWLVTAAALAGSVAGVWGLAGSNR